MKVTTQIWVALAWIAGAALCASFRGVSNATLEFDPGQFIQLGRVPIATHEAEWQVVNTGDVPVEIIGASGSCSCLELNVPLGTIAPGEMVPCEARISVSSEGPFAAAAFLDTRTSSSSRRFTVMIGGIGTEAASESRFDSAPIEVHDAVPGVELRFPIAATLAPEISALGSPSWHITGSGNARIVREEPASASTQLRAVLTIPRLVQGQVERGFVTLAKPGGKQVLMQAFVVQASMIVRAKPVVPETERRVDARTTIEVQWAPEWHADGVDCPDWARLEDVAPDWTRFTLRLTDPPPADAYLVKLVCKATRSGDVATTPLLVRMAEPATQGRR